MAGKKPKAETEWTAPREIKLLSGGNPQIPMGYGDAPIKAYIGAMPSWKKAIGAKLDKLIEISAPGVLKAVKWNSPMYGMERDHYFLSFHVFDKYVKVTFMSGAQLDPPPPSTSKYESVRYLDIHEGEFDEAQFADWVKQASRLPGEKM
jgi:hypothetical protein